MVFKAAAKIAAFFIAVLCGFMCLRALSMRQRVRQRIRQRMGKKTWCPIIRPAQYVVVEKLNIHSYNVIIKRTVVRNICLLIREWLYGRQDHSSL